MPLRGRKIRARVAARRDRSHVPSHRLIPVSRIRPTAFLFPPGIRRQSPRCAIAHTVHAHSHRVPSHSASPSSPPAPLCYTAGGGGDGAGMLNKRDPPPCIPSLFLPVLLSTLPSLLYRRGRATARACSTSGRRRAFSASANASTAAASDRRWCQTHRPRAGSIETCAFCNIHRLPT